MDTFTSIRTTRRLIWTGIIIGSVPALLFTVLRMANSDHLGAGEVLGSIALGLAIALPVAFAWLSLDRRPGLLPVAAAGALVVGVFSILALAPWLLVSLLWLSASRRRSASAERGPRAALHRIGLIAALVAALVVLFVHADPVCTETSRDGTVHVVDASAQGFSSGWSFSLGGSVESRSGGGEDVVSSSCASDTIVIGEAIASLAITSAALVLATRWPTNSRTSDHTASHTTMEV